MSADALRQRPIKQLRDTLSMLCDVLWNGGKTKPGQHLWTIPVDHERDFDCILSDAIDELERLRAEPSLPAPEPDPTARLTDEQLRKVRIAYETAYAKCRFPAEPYSPDALRHRDEAGLAAMRDALRAALTREEQ